MLFCRSWLTGCGYFQTKIYYIFIYLYIFFARSTLEVNLYHQCSMVSACRFFVCLFVLQLSLVVCLNW